MQLLKTNLNLKSTFLIMRRNCILSLEHQICGALLSDPTFQKSHKLNLIKAMTSYLNCYKLNTQISSSSFMFLILHKKKKQHIITWDIKNDLEVDILTLNDSDNKQFVQIWRGISERQNFFIPQENDYYYDLRYKFPKNFMSGRRAGKYLVDFPYKFKNEE